MSSWAEAVLCAVSVTHDLTLLEKDDLGDTFEIQKKSAHQKY